MKPPSRRPTFQQWLFIGLLVFGFTCVGYWWNSQRGRFRYLVAVSSANQLWMSCSVYADKHEGRYPDSFKVLLDEGYLDAGSFRHLVLRSAADSEGPNGDWLYHGSGRKNSDDDFLLAELKEKLWHSGIEKHQRLLMLSRRGVEAETVEP